MLSQEKIEKNFKWNADRRRLEWRAGRPGVREGMPAGGAVGGGLYVTLDWVREPVRNIVYALHAGHPPRRRVHHIDGDPYNVQPDNLHDGDLADVPTVSLRKLAGRIFIYEDGTRRGTYELAEVDAALDHAAALLVS